ncbi:hypothetical protein POSPLADRAFT_1044422 [Postia placenta MAD-698-R-SB12]|uniref:DNA polymerase alpha/delta/epsilon subunit B domain-containing protein n=1 Tax=Postia placenta MAD-698-R-SB12 TaxID=670580 RepID=A0A1X6N8N2_9APHY|nr:hypothetical protein POSPLADRAFT_1044422 [Postia placenta MAD-698-R-SB12]OSX64998.1 hypothetical protein POSPLADRAFT_1044422 [Postia placenta MAD-698-R-SB12]
MSTVDTIPVPETPLTRPPTAVVAPSPRTPSFVLGAANRSYKHQYSSIYYVRLQVLRKYVMARARRRWHDVAGQLSYVIGTVYMDMPMKPNVLEDLARDHSLPAPATRMTYCSQDDQPMLEDESGRIALVGERIRSARLVTGVVLGILGIETSGGEFEVVDICTAGMAPQPYSDLNWGESSAGSSQEGKAEKMDVDETPVPGQEQDEWVAILSGLEIGSTSPADAQIQMLAEYLTGEAGGLDDQASAARISRLIVAGNSLAHILNADGTVPEEKMERKGRRYGQDSANFSPHPTQTLAAHITDIARTMPIHVLPGASDPAGTLLPQQPFPRAMFGSAAAFASFTCETNPTYLRVGPSPNTEGTPDGEKGKQKASASASKSAQAVSATPFRTFLVSSGQPVDDMLKYLPSPLSTRLSIAEASLRWRHIAPTAPDTLWCHPYFGSDPFVISETPDVYIVGCQPRFGTRVVEERGWGPTRGESGEQTSGDVDMEVDGEEGEEDMEGEGGIKRCRIVLAPGFRETGTLVLLNMRTLAVRTVQFAIEGMNAGGET